MGVKLARGPVSRYSKEFLYMEYITLNTLFVIIRILYDVCVFCCITFSDRYITVFIVYYLNIIGHCFSFCVNVCISVTVQGINVFHLLTTVV